MKTLSIKANGLATSNQTSMGQLVVKAVQKVIQQFAAWRARAEQRQQLMQLDDRTLSDIGLTRTDVAWESNKHFWQA